MVAHINEEVFESKVLNSNKITVVDFFATWCGPCKMLSPVIDELSEQNENVDFYKVNVDENPQLAQTYDVNTIPNVLIFKNGERIANSIGYKSLAQMQEFIDKAR